MTTTTAARMMRVVLIAAAMSGVASEVSAQAPRPPASLGFVNVNIGTQPVTRSIEISNSFPIYDETATFGTTQTIGSGAVFDISTGYRVWNQVAVGVGFSNFRNTSSSPGAVTIPDPLVFNRPRQVSLNVDNLEHSERAVHVLAVFFVPITNEFDIAISAGPSFFRLSQDLVASVNIPAQTQNATPVVSTEKKSAVGGTFGIDGTYMVTRNFGGGVFIRYAGAKAALPSAPELRVGGFQAGAGARVRF